MKEGKEFYLKFGNSRVLFVIIIIKTCVSLILPIKKFRITSVCLPSPSLFLGQ